jgi:hypothetical protein
MRLQSYLTEEVDYSVWRRIGFCCGGTSRRRHGGQIYKFLWWMDGGVILNSHAQKGFKQEASAAAKHFFILA